MEPIAIAAVFFVVIFALITRLASFWANRVSRRIDAATRRNLGGQK